MNASSAARRVVPGRGRPRIGKQTGRADAAAALLEAAEDVAAARGIDATTIAAIAGRAGVAVGTLYNYFPDRDALFAALFNVRRTELVPRIEAAAHGAARLPFERRLRSFLAGVLAVFEDRRKFLQVVMADQKPRYAVRKPAVLATMTDALVEILRADGHRRDRAEAFAHMLVGAMKGLVHHRLANDEPLANDGDFLADTFLTGIARA